MARAFLSILGLMNHYPDVMDNFTVPTGLDREVALNKIMFDTAELCLVYTEPSTFKLLVKNWTESEQYNWEKMWDALKAEYNPIHNYNMTESWEDHSEGTGDGTSQRDVAGYNENSTLVHDSKLTDNNSSEVDSTHEGQRSGNIGVTTSQQMVEAELALRAKHNMYQIIADSFKRHFCIMVY